MNTVGKKSTAITTGYRYFILFLDTIANTADKMTVASSINITIPIGSYKYMNNGKR